MVYAVENSNKRFQWKVTKKTVVSIDREESGDETAGSEPR